MRNKEESIIQAFVAHLAKNGHQGLKVDRWPDRDKETPRNVRIDAVAGNFAIEHTSIDGLKDKRGRDPQFLQALGNLENELKGSFPFHLSISVGYRAIGKGQDWEAVRKDMQHWLLIEAVKLSYGRHRIAVEVGGVPLDMRVWKRKDLAAGLFLSRHIDDADVTLEDNVASLVKEKAKKLSPYSREGRVRVLLVEGSDIAMLNHIVVAEAIEARFVSSLPAGTDVIWYADTHGSEPVFYNLNLLLENRAARRRGRLVVDGANSKEMG